MSESDGRPLEPFFDLVPGLCFVLDPARNVKAVNTAATGILGYEAAELAGRPVTDVVHPDERSTVTDLMSAELRSHGLRHLDVRLRTRVGGYRWFRWTASRWNTPDLYVAATEPRGLMAFAGAEHPNDPLRLFVERVTDYAIYLTDPQGFVTTWNAGAVPNSRTVATVTATVKAITRQSSYRSRTTRAAE